MIESLSVILLVSLAFNVYLTRKVLVKSKQRVLPRFKKAPIEEALPKEVEVMLPVAKQICSTLESESQSYEWKYHQAFAKLSNLFMEANPKDISLAIDVAVRSL